MPLITHLIVDPPPYTADATAPSGLTPTIARYDLSELDNSFDDAAFSDIWRQAMEEYERTTKTSLSDPAIYKAGSINDLVQMVESGSTKFQQWRWPSEQRKRFLGVFKGAMRSVEILVRVVGDGIGDAFPPSKIIFNSISHLIQTGATVTKESDNIIRFFTDIKAFLDRMNVHDNTTCPPALRKIFVEILVCVLTLCALTTKSLKSGKTIKFFKALARGEDDDLAEAYAQLQRLIDLEGRMTGAQTLKVTSHGLSVAKETHQAVNAVSNTVTGMDAKLEEIMEKMKEKEGDKMREKDSDSLRQTQQFLAPVSDVKNDYENVRRTLLPGTASWILEDFLFKTWVGEVGGDAGKVLWVSGSPGSGKTFISGFIARTLSERYPQRVQDPSRISVAYFFLRENDKKVPEKRSMRAALRTMAMQVAENDKVYMQHVLKVARISPNLESFSVGVIWKELFTDFFLPKCKSSVFLVIDGLDEADAGERQDFIEVLGDVDENNLNIRVALIGRPELTQDILQNIVPCQVVLTARRNAKDIEHFIKHKIARSRLKSASQALKTEVIEALTQGANGMFLWIDLMIKELLHKIRPEQVRAALKNMPKGLPEMYTQVLTRLHSILDEEMIEDVSDILRWVACGEAALTYEQLRDALKLRTGEDMFCFYELLERCGSILAVFDAEGALLEEILDSHDMRGDDDGGEGGPCCDDDRKATVADRDDVSDDEDDFGADAAPADAADDEDADKKELQFQGATVKLRHLSLGEYLRTPAAAKFLDPNAAEVHIVTMLFKMFVQETHVEPPSALVNYGGLYWLVHFIKIDFTKVSLAKKVALANDLYAMFHRPDVQKMWLITSFRAIELGRAEYSGPILAVLAAALDPEAEGVEAETRAWAEELVAAPQLLSLPIAKWAAHTWLTELYGLTGHAYIYAYVLHQSLGVIPEIGPRAQPWTWDDFRTVGSAEELLALSRWAIAETGAPITAESRRAVAFALRETGFVEEAIEWCDKSLALGEMAITHATKSLCLEKLGRLEEAIAEQLICSQGAEHATYWSTWAKLGALYKEAGKQAEATAAYRKAYEIAPAGGAAAEYLACLAAERNAGQYTEVLDALPLPMLVSQCTGFEMEFHKQAYDNAQLAGKLPALLKRLAEAVRTELAARRPVQALLCRYWLAWHAARDPAQPYSRALRQYRRVLRDGARLIAGPAATHPGAALLRMTVDMATEALAAIYYERAVAGIQPDGTGLNEAALCSLTTLVENAVKSQERTADDDDAGMFVSTRNCALLLGKVYLKLGQVDKCRATIKERLQLGVDLLSDTDPENDFEASYVLTRALLLSGDTEGALTAMQVNMTDLEDGEVDDAEPAKSEHEPEDKPKLLMLLGCDGICHAELKDKTMMCTTCLNVDYCDPCIEVLRAGNQPYRRCDPTHEFVQFPPPGLPQTKSGNVYFRGEEIALSAWLDTVRKEYGLK
ncbi:hypothetical protein DFH27DRAFT_514271 [Peziza echinospora]|nr:hypothetical protein DFH27DRAFT_514271 [Peziza echinospora]